MHSSIGGLIGETSVPVGDITLTSADHVAGGHTLDDNCVSMTAWKLLWASLSTKAGKNLMNRHQRPNDLWRQLEFRHAPKTMGETSIMLEKFEQCKTVPTSDPMPDIAALSDIRAPLTVREIAITDQMTCVHVLASLLRVYEYKFRHFQSSLTPTSLDRFEHVV